MEDTAFRPLPTPGALLIVPASLMQNWLREINDWTHLRAGLYHGSGRQCTQLLLLLLM